MQLLLKVLCVKLKPAILPRQFVAALWFLTKVISALLPLLNKKALMVSILWDGGGVQGFHPSCLPESFLPLERPAVFALPGPCLCDPYNDLSSHQE